MDNVRQWKHVQEVFKYWEPSSKVLRKRFVESWAPQTGATSTTIRVLKSDTLEAAKQLTDPLVLIFADDIRPGGCVEAGAGMQEESLFRRSALFRYLTSDLYPIAQDEALYARDVPLLDGGTASFIACPGIKMPRLTSDNKLMPSDATVLKKKIELILQVASEHGHPSVVLGAVGCGVYGSPPRHVASIMKDVLCEYDGVIKDVVIAVIGATVNFFRDAFGPVGSEMYPYTLKPEVHQQSSTTSAPRIDTGLERLLMNRRIVVSYKESC